jgi:Double zinc ribbon
VEEARPAFRQCTRCGQWVCAEVCWNARANQCESCAPDYQEHLAANQAQVKVDAARQQMYDRAAKTDYASGIDMSADAQVGSATAITNTQAKKNTCAGCGAELAAGAKFCGECGQAAAQAGPKTCGKCGHVTDAKFCPECGNKMA